MMPIDGHLLRSTRPLTTWVVALLCWWVFGNLYELNGALGVLVRGPKPGELVGAFEVGSPSTTSCPPARSRSYSR